MKLKIEKDFNDHAEIRYYLYKNEHCIASFDTEEEAKTQFETLKQKHLQNKNLPEIILSEEL